jgi:hypothetical protein
MCSLVIGALKANEATATENLQRAARGAMSRGPGHAGLRKPHIVEIMKSPKLETAI